MPQRMYECNKCHKVALFESSLLDKSSCLCGGKSFKRASFVASTPSAPTTTQGSTTVVSNPSPPPTPSDSGSSIPTAPTPPPAPVTFKGVAAKTVATKGTTLQEQIANSQIKLNRTRLQQNAADKALAQLPPPPQGQVINEIIRCAAQSVKNDKIADITISFPLFIPWLGRGGERCSVALPGEQTIDLSLPLSELVKGTINSSEHRNADGVWGNFGKDLPDWINEKTGYMATTTDKGYTVSYREYGWFYSVPATVKRATRTGGAAVSIGSVRKEDGNLVSLSDGKTRGSFEVYAGGQVSRNGGKVDAGLRFVISDWGYVFFTPDHYKSFYLYDPVNAKWVKYTEKKKASASYRQRGWFHDGHGWKVLPATAPNYW